MDPNVEEVEPEPEPEPEEDLTEVALYDGKGLAGAYIATDLDSTVYLYNGEPVAYLTWTVSGISLYGFNGKHLGWLEERIIRDHAGRAVAVLKGALPGAALHPEPPKWPRKRPPRRSRPLELPIRPPNRREFAKTPLREFLARGSRKRMAVVLRAMQ